jgi:serine/threonine protein kinase
MKKERLQRIGHFTVKIRLGQGGMGTVYLCHDQRLDRFIAVKVLRRELCSGKRHRERFLNEARALATVSNPHVVHIYEVEPGESPYFAMEYIEGDTVAELLRKQGAFSVPEACRIIDEAARGLKAMHDNGIVHRDVTP